MPSVPSAGLPFLTLRPYLGQPIKVEEYVDGDHYMIRAELAGIDPDKDVEVTVATSTTPS